MRTSSYMKAMVMATFVACAASSCKSDKKEAEAREEEKVGKVYDPEQQGMDHENRDNQFPASRNDNKEGTGLETGAPSDTTTVNESQNQ